MGGTATAPPPGGHLRLGRHAHARGTTSTCPQQWRVFAREVHGLPVEDPTCRSRTSPRPTRWPCGSTRPRSAAWSRGRETHESASIEAILADAGVDAAHDRHLLALAAYRGFWEPHTHTDPQVRPLWEGLHDRGLKVGVLSNTIWSRDYHREVFQRDGVLDLARRRRLLLARSTS